METTRHVTATVYVVNDGATALHEHKRHGIHIPPGGHVDRDELPHEAGLREVREEMGHEATLLDEPDAVAGQGVRALPDPRRHLLYDINAYDGAVGHQHIDLIYYATVPDRRIEPASGEVDSDAWAWYTPSELRAAGIQADVVALGTDSIAAVRAVS